MIYFFYFVVEPVQIRNFKQGGRGHWIGYYTGIKSSRNTFSHLLAKKHWGNLEGGNFIENANFTSIVLSLKIPEF